MFKYLRDLLSANGTGGALTSLGVVGPTIGIAVMIINTFFLAGDPITEAEIEAAKTGFTTLVNAAAGLWTWATAVIGRVRARKRIGGGNLV